MQRVNLQTTKKKCEFKPAFNGNGKGRQLSLI